MILWDVCLNYYFCLCLMAEFGVERNSGCVDVSI